MENINITGSGSMAGGEYGSVIVNGMGKCSGSVRAEQVSVGGTFKVEGGVECRTAAFNGTFKCEGSLSAEEVTCNGAATVESGMVANKLHIAGILKVEGDRLQSRELSCDGILKMDGLVVCESLRVSGIIKAEQIEGKHVRIRSQRPAVLRRFLPSKGLSSAEYIQGEELDLSGVTAETVSGTHITIGPDCRIERVRCNGTLSIHPQALVEDVAGEYEMR